MFVSEAHREPVFWQVLACPGETPLLNVNVELSVFMSAKSRVLPSIRNDIVPIIPAGRALNVEPLKGRRSRVVNNS